MKKFYLILAMALVAMTLHAAATEEPFLHFGLTSYEDWTYHRSGVNMDQNFISQGRVNLMVTEGGELATLESPVFSGQSIDSIRVYVDYRPHVPYVAAKVALQIDVIDAEGNVLSTVTQDIAPNVMQQDVNVMLAVPTDGNCSLLFSAPKADTNNCAAVYEVKVWSVTAGDPVQPQRGDVNGDGKVDVSDVNILINIMLGKANLVNGSDLNGDGKVDVGDVNVAINLMLGKGQ